MVDQVSLSGALRTDLFSLQQTTRLGAQADERLGSGLQIRNPLDGAQEFFQSNALSDRAGDLTRAKDGVDQAISTVQAATNGLDAIDDLTQQAEGLARAARATSDPAQREALAGQFNEVLNQIDNIAQDAGFNGTNLVQSTPDNLPVALNETGSSSVTFEGADSTSGGLGITPTTFASDADIDTALAQTTTARSTVRTNTAGLSSGIAALQTRIEFTQNLTNTLESAAADLTNVDLNEAAANRLAIDSRQQIGLNSLSLGAQSESAILGLFG
jgi:flagellin-like hook-associated protein FlgL